MARCPKLETIDTGWFSWENRCAITGAVVGNENDKTKVKNLCDPDDHSCQYDKCPVYRSYYR